MSGLHLGVTHEATARVALAAADAEGFARCAALASEQYRHGKGSTLDARFQRLMHDGQRLSPGPVGPHRGIPSGSQRNTSFIAEALNGARDPDECAARALRLLCDAATTATGHLYLLGPNGVRLAASYPPSSPPGGLREFIQGIALELAGESVTEVITGPPEPEAQLSVFVDACGDSYRAVPLLSVLDGFITHVGTVALRIEEGTKAVEQDVTLAIATHLSSL